MAGKKYERWLTDDGLTLLDGWARRGLTLDQIAHNCGCSLSTLCEWRRKYPTISEALKKGAEVVDLEVENALLSRALGYSYDETTTETIKDENGLPIETKSKTVRRHVSPDTTAQIFWLKNRRPDLWRNNPTPDTGAEAMKKAAEILGGVASAIK